MGAKVEPVTSAGPAAAFAAAGEGAGVDASAVEGDESDVDPVAAAVDGSDVDAVTSDADAGVSDGAAARNSGLEDSQPASHTRQAAVSSIRVTPRFIHLLPAQRM